MNKSIIIAAIIGLLAAGWLAYGMTIEQNEPEVTKPAAVLANDAHIVPVRVMTSLAQPQIDTMIINGQTKAERVVDLKAEISGPVIKLPPQKGDKVSEGEIIIQVAPQERIADLKEAKARLQQARIQYNASRKLSDKGFRAETQLAESEAAFKSAQATVERAQIAIDKLNIKAPFNGVLNDRFVEHGDFLDKGETVARIVDLDPLIVVVNVNERDVEHITPGLIGQVRMATGQNVEGVVSYVSRAADAATRTFRVELTIDNPNSQLADGVTAELTLPLQALAAHQLSPAILVLNDEGEVGVRSVTTDNRVKFIPVRILSQTAEGIWVSGLPDKITIIVVGQDFVVNNQIVQPVDVAVVEDQLRATREIISNAEEGAAQ